MAYRIKGRKIAMINPFDYNHPDNRMKKIRLYMNNGKVEKGIFIEADPKVDNGEGDGFILDVDGDTTVGRLILGKDVERVEFED